MLRTLFFFAIIQAFFGTMAVLAPATAAQVDFVVETLDGSPARGPITRWTESEIEIATASGSKTLAIKDLLSIRPVLLFPSTDQSASPSDSRSSGSKNEATLTDGSTIRLTEFTSSGKRITLKRSAPTDEEDTDDADDKEMKLPRRVLAHVRLQESTPELDTQWQGALSEDYAGDVLVIRKGDALDYVEGVVHSVTPDRVQFKLDGDQIPVKRSKVFGIIFHRRPGATDSKSQCIVFARDGSRFVAQATQLSDERLTLKSQSGFEISLPVTEVDRIDFSAGKIAYLSDLPFERVEWTPYFDFSDSLDAVKLSGQPRRDEGFGSAPLVLDGKEFSKGLALRSRTEVIFRLSRKYQSFSAIAGLDESLGAKGHVTLEILGDNRSLFKKEITGGDPAQPIQLKVDGVKRLTILVDYGENLDVSDFLNLGDAKVSK